VIQSQNAAPPVELLDLRQHSHAGGIVRPTPAARPCSTGAGSRLYARVSARSRHKLSRDAGRDLHHAGGMDKKAIRRAALVTVRRAICERFPPGRERRAVASMPRGRHFLARGRRSLPLRSF
jgi:hypothetical protein